ncbi:hypothetical protein C8F01DRAFT_1366977 [Mycena amicta]|nr:hypothetical protein C8F01DRAFT_1366977 [Mycena amicta]
MFFKILAFSLGVMTLARAGITCSLDVEKTKVAHSFGPVAPGRYQLINAATQTQLRVYKPQDPIFVAYTREYPGPWIVQARACDDRRYTIRNVGLDLATTLRNGDNKVFTGTPDDRGAEFVLIPSEQLRLFLFCSSFHLPLIRGTRDREGKAWSVDRNAVHSDVYLEDADDNKDEQLWRFLRLDN